jgi:probable HAF family extracellular repeat protein
LAFTFITLVGSSGRVFAQNGYTVTDIGPGEGVQINDAGVVIGRKPGLGGWVPFIFDGASSSDLPLPECDTQSVDYWSCMSRSWFNVSLNNAGTAIASDGLGTTLVWSNGSTEALAIGNMVHISSTGRMVGGSSGFDPVAYSDGALTVIGSQGEAWASNIHGQIVGWSTFGLGGALRPFVYAGDQLQQLTMPSADPRGIAVDINDDGIIVGYYYLSDSEVYAFVHQDGTTTTIGTFGEGASTAHRVNKFGDVVGSVHAAPQPNRAFLYQSGQLIDLNTRIPPDSGLHLMSANGINASGQIVGAGFTNNGEYRGFLLTPLPNTVTGSGVSVSAPATLPDGSSSTVSLTFDDVTSSGSTTVVASSDGPPPPNGFKLTDPPVYYDIQTTATFSGNVRVCLGWTEGQIANENDVSLFHHESGDWVDITDAASRDTVNNTVCGTASSLSPFTLFEVKLPFNGFFQPVDNAAINAAKAGSAIPVKFSIGGDQGLDIFTTGYPISRLVQCTTGEPIDTIEETVNAGASSLTYDATSGRYTYVWKTDKSWANSCRVLHVKLSDGEVYTARFTFSK